MESLKAIWTALFDSLRDLLPIIIVIGFFQFAVLQQPIPNLGEIVIGIVFVVIGLTLFVQGLNMSLFPIGESMAYAFATKGSRFLAALLRLRARVWHYHRRTRTDRGCQRGCHHRRQRQHDRKL